MPVNSTQYTNYAASPQLKVNAQDWSGRMRHRRGEYQAASLLNDCIRMVRMNTGEKIIGGELRWEGATKSSGLGGTATILFVGDQYDCSRYMTRADGTTASGVASGITGWGCGRFNVLYNSSSLLGGVGYTYTCDQDILVSVLSTATGATGQISLDVWYSVE